MDALEFMQLHADNAVAQKMPEVMKDLTPEALAQVMPLMAGAPNPLKGNSVVANGKEGDDFIFDVTYTGEGPSANWREWIRDVDGTWKIMKIANRE